MVPFHCRNPRRVRGFTLVEVMVVSAISLMLMVVGATIYNSCLKVYQESQGLTHVFETSKVVNQDMRSYLGSVIGLKGSWITPVARSFPGVANATNTVIDHYYLTGGSKSNAYALDVDEDLYFVGPHYERNAVLTDDDPNNDWIGSRGYDRGGTVTTDNSRDAANWHSESNDYPGAKGWWLPGFYGQRDGTNTDILENDDITVGSFGWPRPDYRMDADANELSGGSPSVTNGGNVACWFYCEEKRFNSPRTLALDNPNILLVSFKFTRRVERGQEMTRLCYLRHQVAGFDTPTFGLVRNFQSYGNMLRAIKIIPYGLDGSGGLTAMTDEDLGWKLDSTGVTGGASDGNVTPQCFDVIYTLRNPRNMRRMRFAYRVYSFLNPQ